MPVLSELSLRVPMNNTECIKLNGLQTQDLIVSFQEFIDKNKSWPLYLNIQNKNNELYQCQLIYINQNVTLEDKNHVVQVVYKNLNPSYLDQISLVLDVGTITSVLVSTKNNQL